MKYGLLASLLTVLGLQLYVLSIDTAEASPSVLANRPAAAPLTGFKPNRSSFQFYNIHAQCARLAFLSGYHELSKLHLDSANNLKPKSVPPNDISYRFGFVDGQVSSIRENENLHDLKGKPLFRTMEAVAKEGYKAICPTRA